MGKKVILTPGPPRDPNMALPSSDPHLEGRSWTQGRVVPCLKLHSSGWRAQAVLSPRRQSLLQGLAGCSITHFAESCLALVLQKTGQSHTLWAALRTLSAYTVPSPAPWEEGRHHCSLSHWTWLGADFQGRTALSFTDLQPNCRCAMACCG